MDTLKPDQTINTINRRLVELNQLVEECRSQLINAPDGHIRIQPHAKDYQYYLRTEVDDLKGHYIRKDDIQLVYKVLQRDYIEKILEEAESEIDILKRFTKRYHPENLIDAYDKLSLQRKQFVKPFIQSDEDFVKNWQSLDYRHMSFEDGTPEFYTSFGLRVRSKSEIMIAEALHRHNIPFRYEFPISISSIGIVHPDFYCLNVRLHKDIPWEHFGMLDNEKYANRNINKLEKYMLSNYMPGNNLILTFESLEHPLDSRVIEKCIAEYLL